jgi:hypothetical protein
MKRASRLDNHLYLDGKDVASVDGFFDPQTNEFEFTSLTSNVRFDFSKN